MSATTEFWAEEQVMEARRLFMNHHPDWGFYVTQFWPQEWEGLYYDYFAGYKPRIVSLAQNQDLGLVVYLRMYVSVLSGAASAENAVGAMGGEQFDTTAAKQYYELMKHLAGVERLLASLELTPAYLEHKKVAEMRPLGRNRYSAVD